MCLLNQITKRGNTKRWRTKEARVELLATSCPPPVARVIPKRARLKRTLLAPSSLQATSPILWHWIAHRRRLRSRKCLHRISVGTANSSRLSWVSPEKQTSPRKRSARSSVSKKRWKNASRILKKSTSPMISRKENVHGNLNCYKNMGYSFSVLSILSVVH